MSPRLVVHSEDLSGLCRKHEIRTEDGELYATVFPIDLKGEEIAQRFVDCWNNCEEEK